MSNLLTENVKRWFSFLLEIPVTSVQSEVSGKLTVSLKRGKYKLNASNAVYSFDNEYTSFLVAFRKLGMEKRQGIRKVLVFGAGLGSIPLMLEKTFHLVADYTLVDIDPVIIELYQRFGYLPAKGNLRLQQVSAEDFAHKANDRYDLICVDVYIGEKVPASLMKPGFLQSLGRLLTDRGLLLFSLLTTNLELQITNERFYQDVFLPAFPDGFRFKAGLNEIFAVDRHQEGKQGLTDESTGYKPAVSC